MPERWESQIRRLRDLESPEGLRERMVEGPRGEPPAPSRRRVTAAVTALVVFAAAGVLVVRALAPADAPGAADPTSEVSDGMGAPQALTLELLSNDGAPAAALRYGDRTQPGQRESYDWCSGDNCVGGIADFVRYPPVWEYMVVQPGTAIDVTGDGTLSTLRVTDPDGEPVAGAERGAVPDADGLYAFEAEATWPEGNANFFFGVQVLSSPEAAPTVLGVDCSVGLPILDTAVVRTQADGLHLEFHGTEGYAGFEIVTPEGTPPDEAFGAGGDFRNPVMPIDPDRWEIGCHERGKAVSAGDGTTMFELIDPEDFYAPVELACPEPVESETATDIANSVPPEEAATEILTGLAPDDRLRDGGYGAWRFKLGPTYVVERAGQTIARLTLGAPADTWSATLWTCEDSGIAISGAMGAAPAQPAEATDQIPDVLVLRCEGARPVLESDVVRLRADGLHVQAATSDEVAARLVTDHGSTEGFVLTGSEPATFVVSVAPGKVWVVACLPPDEQVAIDSGSGDPSQSWVQVTVLPAAG